MAEDKFEPREINFRQWLPWTQLFRGFWVAADPKKLLLAAAGILTMAFGWWLLAWAFSHRAAPDWRSGDYTDWAEFKAARNRYNLLYEAAGATPQREDANDLAHSPDEFDRLIANPQSPTMQAARIKPYGKLRTWPFWENRGPNPFMLVTGRAGYIDDEGIVRAVPWEQGHFVDWFVRDQVPVLLEPLVKFLRPGYYLLSPNAGFIEQVYFLLVILWTVGTWAFFGGAITRMAAVEIARNEKISLGEAVRYTLARWKSYLFASYAPLIGVALITIVLMLFGLGNWIPGFAELWNGLLWWVALLLGLFMAFLLVGLVGWPLIHATLGAEGSDSFDALSRCYSYVLQKPWSYLWNVLVALVYGAIVVFFVGFIGSLTVYLGKWGVSHSPFMHGSSRDPSYMFVFAPTSFHWRELLLQGSPVLANSSAGTEQGAIDAYIASPDFHWWNYIGAVLVAFWLYLVFLMIIGFGYSYFWSESTIIYLLMRRKVDDTDLDEVYLEEADGDDIYSAPVTAPSSAAPPPPVGSPPVQMVEAPTLRTSTTTSSPASPAPTAESSTPHAGDGNPPTGAGPG